MRDIPMFTTDYGIASLVLKEVPYKGEAYILLRSVNPGSERQLIEECAQFCRAAGAEKVLASNLESCAYPQYALVLTMRGEALVDPEKVEHLFPVTEETVGKWRSIWNERSRNVDCAATLDSADSQQILESNGAYFVHHRGELLGIGWIRDNQILTVASVIPGSGERVMHSLMSLVEGESLSLEVASTNTRAIRLYEKLGFVTVSERTRWYQII